MGNLDKMTGQKKPLRRAGHNRSRLMLAGVILLIASVSTPTSRAFSVTNPNQRLETTAANYLAARQAVYFRDIGASAAFYLNALNSDRDNANLLQQAFYTQFQLGHIDAAATLASEIELQNLTIRFAREPATAQAVLQKDWDAVLVLADSIAENLDAQPMAAVIKSWAFAAKGRGAAGLSHLMKIGKTTTASGQIMPAMYAIQAARLAEHIGDKAEMRLHAETLFARRDLSSQAMLQLASLYARNGEFDKMDQMINRLPLGFNHKLVRSQLISQQKPPTISSHIADGIIDASLIDRQSQDSSALNARLGLALYLDDANDGARFLLAQALQEMEQPLAAIAKLDAIDETSIWGQPSLLLRSDLERRNDMAGAISQMKAAVAKDQENAHLQQELGNLYRMASQFDKARDAYLVAVDLGFVSGDLYRNLAICYEQLEQDELAETSFKAALKENPDDPFTLNYLGYWWADDGRNLDEAIKLIEKAVRLRPRSGFFVDSLGWVHFKLRNYDLAVAFLEQATILEPMDAVITGHLGDAYWEVGRHREARFKWQYALSIATKDDLKAEFTAKLNP